MGQNNWGAVPLSDGLDTRPCKILDPSLVTAPALTEYADPDNAIHRLK